MKIKKSIDLGDDAINITTMFEIQLLENCNKTSNKYKNNMESFQEFLQEVADKAFKLGQEDS